jgi:hypothetical protein
VVQGSFKNYSCTIDDWVSPSLNLERKHFILNSQNMDVLHVPSGYVSSIQNGIPSKLLLMSDYALGEINDEYRLISIILQYKGLPFLKVTRLEFGTKPVCRQTFGNTLALFPEEFERSIFKRVLMIQKS